MDANKQMVKVPEREPLTENEARKLGTAAIRLPRLRYLLRQSKENTGRIVVGSGPSANAIEVGSADLQAALSLLIERDELLMASLNVEIDR